MPKKLMPAAERQQESKAARPAPPPGALYNWPDTGHAPGHESALTWAGEPLKPGSKAAGTEGQVRRDDEL